MIKSMTGYGKAVKDYQDQTITVELRGVNSKSLDLSTRMPSYLFEKELDIRQLIATRLERGKVDLNISITLNSTLSTLNSQFPPINAEAFKFYYKQLADLQSELGIPASADLVGAVMRLPAVTKAETQEASSSLDPELAKAVIDTLNEALDAFIAFRTQEGAALQAKFTEQLDAIEALKAEVEPFEKGRVEHIREHLLSNLDKLAEETKQRIDSNRLEQEMIYYLEKLDITEEKVRLTNHIKYFRETMDGDGTGVGKKLGFIAQEMGREINTLGSKSNQSQMQIIVVKMKDLLEQIKEQVLNVL
ncbi:MAG: YicC family protein [Paludibacteraceae bacterium]|nr:YicC family protein [Paludibacteraceae bacterium]